MLFHSFAGRIPGLATCSVLLALAYADVCAADAAPRYAEVGTQYKARGLAEFQLAQYTDELLECSALAAVHTMINDNIGEDAGTEVRKTLATDYWIEVSHDYLSLAEEASGSADLLQEVAIRIRGLFAQWRHLTDTEVSADDWNGWYELTDRCDTWRPATPTHSYYTKGRKPVANQNHTSKVAMSAD